MCYFSTFFLHTIKSTPLKIVLLRINMYVKCIYDFCTTSRARRTFHFTGAITRRTTAITVIVIKVARYIASYQPPLKYSTTSFFLAPKMHLLRNHLSSIFIVILTLWFFTYELSIIHTSPVRPFIFGVPPTSIQESPLKPKKEDSSSQLFLLCNKL